jgi:hypothetical protein
MFGRPLIGVSHVVCFATVPLCRFVRACQQIPTDGDFGNP